MQVLTPILYLALVHLARSARPFYVIGHMVNTVEEAKDFVGRGANALEMDINFNQHNVSQITAYHGIPCDCFRICGRSQPLQDLLEFTRKNSERLALLFFDIKLNRFPEERKKKAGEALGNLLQRYLWKDSKYKTKVLISIERPSDVGLVHGVLSSLDEDLRKYAGWDVSMNYPLAEIRSVWERSEVGGSQFWQGDGITNCLSTFRGFGRLRDAVRLRNKANGYISKVYHWTIDFRFMMRYSLQHRLDGMITNHPERAIEVLNEFGPRTYRLATPEDDPWLKIPERSEKFPSENALQNLLQGFTLLQTGKDLRDSAKNLLGELLGSFGSNLVGRGLGEDSDLQEVFSFFDSIDQLNVTKPGSVDKTGEDNGVYGGTDNGRGVENNGRPLDNNGRGVNNNRSPLNNNERRVNNNRRPLDNNERRVNNNRRPLDNNERRVDNNRRPLDNNGRDVTNNGNHRPVVFPDDR